jgi:hypothetical protein
MVGINNLSDIIRIRRDVEVFMKKLKEFIEENDIEGKMETACNKDKIKLMCMPNGCVVHILDGDKARYSLIISNPPELTIIDWNSKTTQNLNNNEEVNRILRELGAEEDMEECISEYISEKEELLSKLKAVMTLLNIL